MSYIRSPFNPEGLMVYSSYNDTIEFVTPEGVTYSFSERMWWRLVQKYLKIGGFSSIDYGDSIKAGDIEIGYTKDGYLFLSGQAGKWVIYMWAATLDYIIRNYAEQHGLIKVKYVLDKGYRA